ncbi:MAG: response regulator transcription factor [Spirochaetia bacterium]|nr:response regulator transcription factor [Spirochaetia bacterium]
MSEQKFENNILLIEDDSSISRLICVTLKTAKLKCTTAENGETGLSLFSANNPDLVLLDLGLPDMDGMNVLLSIRGKSNVPVIVVSARNQEQDIIDALDGGADDYVTKPFRPGELVARIHAALRKKSGNAGESQIFESDSLVIDFKKRLVTVDGCEVHLTPTEYKLLELLVENAGKVLTHRYIAEKVWGHVAVEDFQFVRVTMANLRRKIEHDTADSRYILTETGVGYRFRA